MKKLLFIALASFITITTRHEQPMNLKQATEIYGEDIALVFRNNECIGGYEK